jgi:fructose-1,6-bisphosphatase/sedoheptulose 1,7-bisphosphatase-like protein
VLLANEIVAAIINQQIVFEGRLLIKARHTSLKAKIRCLDIAVSVVDADGDLLGGIFTVFEETHIVFLSAAWQRS